MDPYITSPELRLSTSGQTDVHYRKDLKLFSYLGGIQSKVNFLHTCFANKVIPKGFNIQWQDQTGFNSYQLSEQISVILKSTSLALMKAVLDVSQQKFEDVGHLISEKEQEVPEDIWQKGIQNYNFFLSSLNFRKRTRSSRKHLAKGYSELQFLLQPVITTLNKKAAKIVFSHTFDCFATSQESIIIGC